MDISHLVEDEIKYELALRDINPNDRDAISKLKELVAFEEISGTPPQLDSARLTRKTVDKELQDCERKLAEVAAAIDAATKESNEHQLIHGRSRLLHVTARIMRLKKFAPEVEAVKRLLSRTLEIGESFSIARKSGVSEKDLYVEGTACGGGAIPKSSRNIVNNQIEQTVNIPRPSELTSQLDKQMSPQQINALSADFARVLAAHLQHANENSQRTNRSLPSLDDIFPMNVPNPRNSQHEQNKYVQNAPSIADIRRPHRPQLQNHQPQSIGSGISEAEDADDEAQRGHRPVHQPRRNGHRIHQWSLRFDGSPDGLDAADFLFRVERQADLYGVSHGALVIGFGDLLKGRAEQWYWTIQRQYGNITWDDLKHAFIRRYASHRETDYEIRAKIETRKQRIGEPFNNFCQDIEALASRLARRMSEGELVEILQRNMQMALKKALWRERVQYVDELIRVCTEYEKLCREEEWQNKRYRVHELSYPESNAQNISTENQHNQIEAIRMAGTNNNLEICWNCKDIGHVFSQCKVPQSHIFCYWCGAPGVLSANCQRCSENRRKGGTAAVVRPSHQSPPPPQNFKPTLHPFIPYNPFSRPPPS